jgi:hypothetical protein
MNYSILQTYSGEDQLKLCVCEEFGYTCNCVPSAVSSNIDILLWVCSDLSESEEEEENGTCCNCSVM